MKKRRYMAVATGLIFILAVTACNSGNADVRPNEEYTGTSGYEEDEETTDGTTEDITMENKTEELTEETAIQPTAIQPTTVQPTTEQPTTVQSTTVQPQAQQSTEQNNKPQTTAGTPVANHGALRVNGTKLTDKNGQPFQLYGMSTHGLIWFPQYVNYDAFKTLRDDWNTNCVRLAMYTAEYNGYCTGGNKEEIKGIVKNGVRYATDLGMYVIIDWHVLNDQDPNVYKAEAIEFFREMSALYAGYDNVIYEICNEPNSWSTWDSIKAYANEVIPVIRANDPDAVIIVGTPTWSQDIDKALASPLAFDNVMYALHFYAATHTDWLRDRVKQCVDGGLPVFISEFGICDASGNGGIDYNQSTEWMNLIKNYNLSYCCWNLANKNETSSVIASWCQKTSGWTESELSDSGKWIRNQFRSED